MLWQGAPEGSTFFGPGVQVTGGLLIGAGVALALGLLDGLHPMLATITGAPKLIPALAAIVIGVLALAKGWRRRGVNWAYAITDQRLMSVLRDRLIRSVPPEKIEPDRLRTTGGIVYWQRASRNNKNRTGTSFGPEGQYVGFHGQQDPQALRERIVAWREGFSERASAAAAEFVAARGTGNIAGVTRVSHADTGLHLDVPSGWKITVMQRQDGPLVLFGVTLLKRFIRDGKPRPYGDGAPWNVLSVRGAPDAGLEMQISDGPLAMTLDGVLQDPWASRLGLKVLQTTPEMQVGAFKGFALVRHMPKGGQLIGFGQVDAPVAVRQIWLGSGQHRVEFLGMARLDQPDVQLAVDAMVASLSSGR